MPVFCSLVRNFGVVDYCPGGVGVVLHVQGSVVHEVASATTLGALHCAPTPTPPAREGLFSERRPSALLTVDVNTTAFYQNVVHPGVVIISPKVMLLNT